MRVRFLFNSRYKLLGNIVTGNVSSGHTTPSGIYSLKYKQRDAVLRGQGYASPVTFWMPFNGGIGMHDAGWRSEFGGNIYKTNGSHGCINSPYALAKSIFDNIEEGSLVCLLKLLNIPTVTLPQPWHCVARECCSDILATSELPKSQMDLYITGMMSVEDKSWNCTYRIHRKT